MHGLERPGYLPINLLPLTPFPFFLRFFPSLSFFNHSFYFPILLLPSFHFLRLLYFFRFC